MDKTYVYRKHLRSPLKWMFSFVVILISSIIIPFVGLVFAGEEKVDIVLLFEISFMIVIIGIFLLLEIVLIYFIFLRRYKFINVRLTDNSIIYTKNKKEIFIPYEDILELKFPSIKYTGGWVKIIHKGGKFRLTVVLENIGDFIYELKNELDKREKSNVYDKKKMFNFYKTASYSDESWQRLYENIKLYISTYYLSMIVTTILVVIKGNVGNRHLIFMSLFIPVIGYIVGEIIIANKVRKRIVDGEFKLHPRDIEFENKIIRITSIYLTIGYIALVMLLTVFI